MIRISKWYYFRAHKNKSEKTKHWTIYRWEREQPNELWFHANWMSFNFYSYGMEGALFNICSKHSVFTCIVISARVYVCVYLTRWASTGSPCFKTEALLFYAYYTAAIKQKSCDYKGIFKMYACMCTRTFVTRSIILILTLAQRKLHCA